MGRSSCPRGWGRGPARGGCECNPADAVRSGSQCLATHLHRRHWVTAAAGGSRTAPPPFADSSMPLSCVVAGGGWGLALVHALKLLQQAPGCLQQAIHHIRLGLHAAGHQRILSRHFTQTIGRWRVASLGLDVHARPHTHHNQPAQRPRSEQSPPHMTQHLQDTSLEVHSCTTVMGRRLPGPSPPPPP